MIVKVYFAPHLENSAYRPAFMAKALVAQSINAILYAPMQLESFMLSYPPNK